MRQGLGAGIGVQANAGERAKEGGEGGYGGNPGEDRQGDLIFIFII